MAHKVKIKKPNKRSSTDELEKMSKDELIAKIHALEAHNLQLQNIINKEESGPKYPTKKGSFDFSRCSFRRILLHFMYLGWDYQGFAVQEDTTNTIEYHLFQALKKTYLIEDRTKSNYHRCGRTDKGVSSFGQVISIDIRTKLDSTNQDDLENEIDYCKILNKVLPSNIQCIAWAPVEQNVSSRFDCLSRTYKYYFPKGKLNIDKMIEASHYLIGSHDFRNFAKMDVGNGVVQFVRNLLDFRIEPLKSDDCNDEYSLYVAIIKGNAFLWHQIRYIMGILLLIGANREEPTVVKDLLDVKANPRKPEYNMASEVPLNLFFCEYDNVKWYISKENLKSVIETLRQIWTFTSLKNAMIKDIINSLTKHQENPNDLKCLTEYLVGGVKPKTYVPVMKRPKCKSLEDKIQHYSKRKRIEIVTDDNDSKNKQS
ncbi:tRNA pseudouridine(38/39) synthase [Anthonomus grandis grandis]|uniref:tRNA pseudouridine(38/39) synthase n=1 Tax=Anthonomus grandis grandis TaxID=2921223 RepID=UPI00216618CF|nr:tRNA pseudouridine(38/39) synthase [Anthonomus grandis grandis]